jgi:hypothetical protein
MVTGIYSKVDFTKTANAIPFEERISSQKNMPVKPAGKQSPLVKSSSFTQFDMQIKKFKVGAAADIVSDSNSNKVSTSP